MEFHRVVAPAVFSACVLMSGACWGADARRPAAGDAAGPASEMEIARLIGELGSSTFMARQHAQRLLEAMGPRAKSALQAATDDPDPEIRQRAKQALAAIADVDFHVRLGAFLSNPDADDGHGLAGWRRYRALAGASPAARRLFADMQLAERELLELAAEAPAQAGSFLDVRCQQLEHAAPSGTGTSARQVQRSLGTMAAMLFAASDAGVAVSGRAGNFIYGFRGQAALGRALNARPTADVVRALLAAWVSRPFENDTVTGYANLLLAMHYNLKEAVAPALSLIEPSGGPPHLQQYAILAIGKLGGREHLAALAPLLKDERGIGVPGRTGRESATQLRDVALAVMLHLTDQKLSDYGFAHASPNPTLLFNSDTLGFNDPAARGEALKKWRAWQRQQPEAP